MALFYIFAVKPFVLDRYYYKTDLVHRFFKAYLENPASSIYRKQFDYITDDLPIGWLDMLEDAWRCLSYDPVEEVYRLENKQRQNHAIIEPQSGYWVVQCPSYWDAEKMVFEPLRYRAGNLFVIEEGGSHFGWISPKSIVRLLS
ncbi:sporulation inhibitor of replication protein SirA [Thalassobacillus sp. CUG 92003]|uniref:sporulation inhibitor of replication protein SirA n=1 Tax=Thalassobacillus sp. CUG 92003 TaxID=2736641 RepID=UPI0015E68413